MTDSILTQDQQQILSLLSREKHITDLFYLTGGTALAEFYLRHRLSEDLDFFAEEIFEPIDITATLKKIQKETGMTKIDYEQSFNRNLFFLEVNGGVIKTEFTYFPFPRIEKKQKYGELYVDSLLDIAVNKVFTIHQKPRSRDFIDLYYILEYDTSLDLDDLIAKAQIKFETYLNPLQLASQFVKVEEVKDYPNMIKEINHKIWQDFFMNEARRLTESKLE